MIICKLTKLFANILIVKLLIGNFALLCGVQICLVIKGDNHINIEQTHKAKAIPL